VQRWYEDSPRAWAGGVRGPRRRGRGIAVSAAVPRLLSRGSERGSARRPA
jgi:hypothetical protein